jgi:tRNA dimethylallyltransferase
MTTVPRLLVVAGPTGTGKSDLALELAERLTGEVINGDAMQLYRGMDIGTAKLTPEQRRGVPHHLLDVLDVTQTASVAVYQRKARAIIADILDRGRTPILTGGSGLYLQAVVDDIGFPPTEPAVRVRWEAEVERLGPDLAHARLTELDPAAAAVILPSNARRIARALEVIELTGRPFSATMPRPGAPRFDAVLLGLDLETEVLDARLADRVDHMVEAGLEAEVRDLLGRGLREGRTAARALGYPQFIDVVDGRATVAQAVQETVRATRRFVRRQRSWFRRDGRIRWLDAARPDLLDAIGQLPISP